MDIYYICMYVCMYAYVCGTSKNKLFELNVCIFNNINLFIIPDETTFINEDNSTYSSPSSFYL